MSGSLHCQEYRDDQFGGIGEVFHRVSGRGARRFALTVQNTRKEDVNRVKPTCGLHPG